MKNIFPSLRTHLDPLLQNKTSLSGLIYVGSLNHDSTSCFWTKGYGDYRLKTSLNRDTLFPIASLTKQFTGMALLLELWEKAHHQEDRLDHLLQQPLAFFIPAFPLSQTHWAHEVTLHQILTHTSGIANYTDFDDHLRLYKTSNVRQGMRSHVQGMKHQKNKVGSFSYCNTGYYLLAEVIEALTGKDAGTWMNEVLFSPLCMTRTFLPTSSFFKKWARDHAIANIALGYKAYHPTEYK